MQSIVIAQRIPRLFSIEMVTERIPAIFESNISIEFDIYFSSFRFDRSKRVWYLIKYSILRRVRVGRSSIRKNTIHAGNTGVA